ncbi:MAG: hypothetical protein M3237_07940 [Actinomycetota bacterium]|nr:hypothetical protein [Actinomycetota bacterium]
MPDPKTAIRLELRWRPVVDQRGRSHMEACWVDMSAPVRPRVTHAA